MNLELPLEKNRNKKSVNKDYYQSLNFERSSTTLPVSNISNIINSYQVYEEEKSSSNKFRLNITLNPIISNVLTNKLTEVKRKADNVILTGSDRLKAIQTINDIDYEYRLGYDIMDNNYIRINSFKIGETLSDFYGISLYGVNSIEESINNNINDDNGWLGIVNRTKINNKMFIGKNPCEKIDFFPSREFLLFNSNYLNGELKENWDFILTYPYENYTDNKLVTDNEGVNGIPVVTSSIVTRNGSNYLSITTAYKHGLNNGDVIKLKDGGYSDNKTYLVYDIGNIDRENKLITFLIDANKYQNISNYSGLSGFRVVRVIGNSDSQYYIRKFRKLPNLSDVINNITEENINEIIQQASDNFLNESYQPAFSRNIYNDSIHQIQYIDDIDLSLIKDNLGRPVSEIFLTIIKKNKIDSNEEPSSLFTQISSGIDQSVFSTGYSNVHLINNIDENEEPLETKITNTGTTINGVANKDCFLGDIVEYNKLSATEIVLDDVYYRFNTVQREQENTFIYSDFIGDDSNLLFYSNFSNMKIVDDNIPYWNAINTSITVPGDKRFVANSYSNYLKCASNNTIVNHNGCFNYQDIIYEKGKDYYITFYARSERESLILDWVGVGSVVKTDIFNEGSASYFVGGNNVFFLSTAWKRFTINFTGDGKRHPLIFGIKKGVDNEFSITKIKIEEKNEPSKMPSDWTLNPKEGEYKFTSKSIKMQPLIEGYFYKAHNRIRLKTYSDVINSSEFTKINMCDSKIKEGIRTSDDQLVNLLYGYNDNEIKYLAIKVSNVSLLRNFDYVRITNNLTKKYINLKIKLLSRESNIILVPYVSSFFGSISNLISDITIRKYSEQATLYSQDLYNGSCIWRDLYKEDLPFTNGRFYASETLNFYLRRQDPFGYYNMRRESFPSDLYGVEINPEINNNIEEKTNSIC